ncbi:MAG: transferase [Candidatus Hydrothermarchaeota archaeon]|nr:MAG: transferase [Candidatus Hydrothermarchaeota archaeon]
MKFEPFKVNKSHGTGEFKPEELRKLGKGVVFEKGVLVFHPENIEIGYNVYIGHYTILKGYYKNLMVIGDHTWIGQQCFLHSAGGLRIGRAVGIGPGVTILTSQHQVVDRDLPVYFSPLEFGEVILEDGCDIGAGSIILPGVTIHKGSIIGAGSVVTKDVPPYEIWAGVPARFIRKRGTLTINKGSS